MSFIIDPNTQISEVDRNSTYCYNFNVTEDTFICLRDQCPDWLPQDFANNMAEGFLRYYLDFLDEHKGIEKVELENWGVLLPNGEFRILIEPQTPYEYQVALKLPEAYKRAYDIWNAKPYRHELSEDLVAIASPEAWEELRILLEKAIQKIL